MNKDKIALMAIIQKEFGADALATRFNEIVADLGITTEGMKRLRQLDLAHNMMMSQQLHGGVKEDRSKTKAARKQNTNRRRAKK